MTTDFYDLLGVDRDASQDEVRKAFREQVREYHPDLNDDPRAPAQFTALKKAYDTLGDPDEREDYDRMGHNSYCANRISGLPSPDEWEIPERQDGSSDADGRPSGDSDTRRGHRSSTGGNRRRSRNRASTGATANSRSNAGTTGSTASAAAASGSGGATRTRSGGGSTAVGDGPTGVAERVLGLLGAVSLGWVLILFADAIYLAGLSLYLVHNEAVLVRVVDRLASSITGEGSVLTVLGSAEGVVPLSSYVGSNASTESAVGGALLILGMALLPSVYFFIIRETRRIRTPWRPSYLYVVAAMGPVVGLSLDAALGLPGLYLEVICFLLLPLLGVLGLPFSAFLLPRIRRTVRKIRHRHWH